MTPQDWEERFKNRFGNYGLFEDGQYAGYQDVLNEVLAWVTSERKAVANDVLKTIHEAAAKYCEANNRHDQMKYDQVVGMVIERYGLSE